MPGTDLPGQLDATLTTWPPGPFEQPVGATGAQAVDFQPPDFDVHRGWHCDPHAIVLVEETLPSGLTPRG